MVTQLVFGMPRFLVFYKSLKLRILDLSLIDLRSVRKLSQNMLTFEHNRKPEAPLVSTKLGAYFLISDFMLTCLPKNVENKRPEILETKFVSLTKIFQRLTRLPF